LKTKFKILIVILLIITTLIIVKYETSIRKDAFVKTSSIKKIEKIKIDSTKNIESISKQDTKKLIDTTVVLYFNDLSNVYNYKIIDKYYCVNSHNYHDSVSRVIKIFNKKDSLIQIIRPNLKMTPWYFLELSVPLKKSRSYVTGKNVNYKDMDNYCGEIVVADLNFDGLEDFATPIDQGADNGPHYAYYIQNKKNRFLFNKYLTENLIWFPEKINDSLMTFTNEIPCTIYGLNYNTFKYDSISKKWRKIEDYTIDIRTGKLMKMN